VGLTARREFDKKTQLHLPTLGGKDEGAQKTPEVPDTDAPPAREKKDEVPASELPGGLAEIIRDLTRRPPS